MPSPIADLLNAIAASPFRIAPKARADLNQVIDSKALALEICADKALSAELIVSSNLIRLGVPFLEVLWAAAHAYIVVFHECQQANKRGDISFAIGGIPRTARAYKLYRELLQAHAAGSPVEWPSLDIRPERYPPQDTDSFIANELFLVAIAWIIHHEIAHARLGHQEVTVTSVSQENEADEAATRWVCRGTKDSASLHKRATGVVTAVVLLIAYDLEVHRTRSKTHPPSFERLIRNLDATGLGESEMIYAFAFKLVEIHLLQSDVPHELDREGAFRDTCISACMALRNVAA